MAQVADPQHARNACSQLLLTTLFNGLCIAVMHPGQARLHLLKPEPHVPITFVIPVSIFVARLLETPIPCRIFVPLYHKARPARITCMKQ
jgi:hypothetical protein